MNIPNILAIILAAGKGTRLKPYTDQLPKTMVPLDGVPLLEYQKRTLNKIGITKINVVTGYKDECINIPNITNIHGWSFPYCLKAFKYLDILGIIFGFFHFFRHYFPVFCLSIQRYGKSRVISL